MPTTFLLSLCVFSVLSGRDLPDDLAIVFHVEHLRADDLPTLPFRP